MGQAILTCVTANNVLKKSEIALFDVDTEKLKSFSEEYTTFSSCQQLVDSAEIVLLSVKPQHFPSVAESVSFGEHNTVLSIMAGVTTESIRTKINYPCPIVRVMPNTPCQLGKGVCAVVFDRVLPDKKALIMKMLMSCGEVIEIEEKYFDAVTSVSGSGPAYVYMFAEAMIKGGISGGLSEEQSKILTVNTLIGTAEMIRRSSEELSVLTEKVCSKGGTTIQAVDIYRQKGLEDIIIQGINACRKRSEELSKG